MKTSKNQVVMPINVATMIDENDPVFKMVEMLKNWITENCIPVIAVDLLTDDLEKHCLN